MTRMLPWFLGVALTGCTLGLDWSRPVDPAADVPSADNGAPLDATDLGTLEDVTEERTSVHAMPADVVADCGCTANQECIAGRCQRLCSATTTRCGGNCVNVNTHRDHCGGCDRPCPQQWRCCLGACAERCD